MPQNASVLIGLSAVIVSVEDGSPQVFTVRGADHGVFEAHAQNTGQSQFALPFGPFEPEEHDTLEIGLRKWVATQTPVTPGYVEQLYTFGNKGRYLYSEEQGPRVISVGYLALTRTENNTSPDSENESHLWTDWYQYFPWEDWRQGRPSVLDKTIMPALVKWQNAAKTKAEKQARTRRVQTCFGADDLPWDNEKILERYELLYHVRLAYEACRDKELKHDPSDVIDSTPMQFDHRRILATAIGRLRGKLKYRPVVFEVMPEDFTLLELQRTVEAISGHTLHKQNFRRLVENSGMVEETGQRTKRGGGRPASLYRFRENVMLERNASGVTLSPNKNSTHL